MANQKNSSGFAEPEPKIYRNLDTPTSSCKLLWKNQPLGSFFIFMFNFSSVVHVLLLHLIIEKRTWFTAAQNNYNNGLYKCGLSIFALHFLKINKNVTRFPTVRTI